MLKTIILLLILFGGTARAQTFGFLGGGTRFDSEASGTSTTRSYPFRLGAGHQLSPNYTLGADLSRYSVNTTAGSVDITDDHMELLTWVRGSFWPRPSWLPYGSVILGVQQDVVTTKFQSDVREDRSKLEWVIGLGIGTYSEFWRGLGAGLEVRGLYRPWASPRYSGDFVGTLGWFF